MTENRILFTGGLVFDGTGSPAVPADVVVRGDRIESVRPGGGTEPEDGDQVVDCAGATVMPGLVESHSHLTFPSAVGHIDPSFNPPLDVSFFRHMPAPDEHLAIAKRNAKILLEARLHQRLLGRLADPGADRGMAARGDLRGCGARPAAAGGVVRTRQQPGADGPGRPEAE